MNLETIGHSTGWLSAKVSTNLEHHVVALIAAGATAVELVEGEERRLAAFEQGSLPEQLTYRSIHLGDFSSMTGEILEARVRRLAHIFKHLDINGASLHPDTTSNDAIAKLEAAQIPLGIENMDRNKRFGKELNDLLSVESQAPFVIDLQHAYENIVDDPEKFKDFVRHICQFCKEGRSVIHLHVSGEYLACDKPSFNHMPLHLATNQLEIIALLKEVAETLQYLPPIILEGDYLFDKPFISSELPDARRDELIALAAKRMKDEIELIKDRVLSW